MKMDDELVKRITQEVMQKLNQNSTSHPVKNNNPTLKTEIRQNKTMTSYDSVIFLLCGGDMEIQEVFRQMELISPRFSKVYVVMTRSATQIVGIPEARRASQGGTIITEYTSEYLKEILFNVDSIYIPIFSLNTAAKVAALNADTLGTITIVFGLMYGKTVIAAKDSIFCCQVEPDTMPKLMLQRINGLISQLEGMGIKMVSINQLEGSSPLPQAPLKPSAPYTTGSAGKDVFINGECNDAIKTLVNGGVSRIATTPGIAGFDKDLAQYIDHTVLKADATEEEIRKLCEEAATYGFASVCVNPTNVALAYEFLRDSPVKVCTVIGFPLGATTPTVKAIETRDAIANGAEEVDMVINVGALKSGNDKVVKEDIESVVSAAKGKAIVKVILETALLTKDQIVKGSLLAKLSGADFVKTSTGFSTAGALAEDIELMRSTIGPEMGLKAAGGIRTREAAEKMIKAGATRIGASASIVIVKST